MQEFDLIVIGGGPGGYLCAERAGKAGLRTALIEKRALGGTCLNEGCIPTKSLLYCAKQYQAALHGADYGVTAQNVSIDHAQVVARKDGVVKTLVRGVGAAMKAHGVTVFTAEGRILGKNGERFEIAAGEEILSAPRLVLASGSSAVIPPIPGVQEGLASGFVMTNRELLSLSEQPESLVCIGGGVIGLEMACYFASIGTKVTVIEMMPKIAGNTDPEICALLMRTYKKQGMDFCLNARVEAVTDRSVVYSDAAGRHEIACGRVLLSAGRRADVSGLNTEALGLALDRGAVVTDRRMRTNVPGVWAIGDCNGKLMLAHTAYREAEVAVNDMLGKKDELVIKRAIHTTADFDYADNLVFSDHAVTKGIEALRAGCDIVTDTQMAKAGINKTILASLGGEVHCFMSDSDVAAEAKARGVTRAIVSMERAAQLPKPCIFAIGNAPTALVSLEALMEADKLHPALIIGVPVGFVNVIESKELVIANCRAPYIVARGRKGGSNVAAAICNAMLYQIRR